MCFYFKQNILPVSTPDKIVAYKVYIVSHSLSCLCSPHYRYAIFGEIFKSGTFKVSKPDVFQWRQSAMSVGGFHCFKRRRDAFLYMNHSPDVFQMRIVPVHLDKKDIFALGITPYSSNKKNHEGETYLSTAITITEEDFKEAFRK